jgi:hypothetical protein
MRPFDARRCEMHHVTEKIWLMSAEIVRSPGDALVQALGNLQDALPQANGVLAGV